MTVTFKFLTLGHFCGSSRRIIACVRLPLAAILLPTSLPPADSLVLESRVQPVVQQKIPLGDLAPAKLLGSLAGPLELLFPRFSIQERRSDGGGKGPWGGLGEPRIPPVRVCQQPSRRWRD